VAAEAPVIGAALTAAIDRGWVPDRALRAGIRAVCAQRLRDERRGGPAAVARDVRAGQRDLVLTLVAPGRLRGTVGDGDGTVWLRRAGGFDGAAASSPLRRATVEAGRFGADGLAPGRWYASVITARGVVAVATIEIRAAAVTEVALATAATRAVRICQMDRRLSTVGTRTPHAAIVVHTHTRRREMSKPLSVARSGSVTLIHGRKKSASPTSPTTASGPRFRPR